MAGGQDVARRRARYRLESGNGAFILPLRLPDHAVGGKQLPIAAPPAPISKTVATALLEPHMRSLHRVKQGAEFQWSGMNISPMSRKREARRVFAGRREPSPSAGCCRPRSRRSSSRRRSRFRLYGRGLQIAVRTRYMRDALHNFHELIPRYLAGGHGERRLAFDPSWSGRARSGRADARCLHSFVSPPGAPPTVLLAP